MPVCPAAVFLTDRDGFWGSLPAGTAEKDLRLCRYGNLRENRGRRFLKNPLTVYL